MSAKGAGVALLVAFLAIALAAGPAGAQARPVILVQVDGQPADFTVRKSGGSADFSFTIGFVCASGADTYGPCTGQVGDTDVQVTFAEPRAPYPGGWRVTMDAKPVLMKARQTHTIAVAVKLERDEPDRDHFVIGLTATARPNTGSSALDPILGSQLGQQSTAADTVEVDKILNAGEQLTSWARKFMWPLLGAGVVLLVAAVVLVERRRGALALVSDAPAQTVAPGRGASFPVRVRNESKNDDRIQLGVGGLPPEWHAVVPLSELDLRSDESTEMWVTVRAPPGASPGQTLSFELRARSLRTGQRDAELPLQVHVVAGAPPPTAPVEPATPPPIDYEVEAPAAPRRTPKRVGGPRRVR